MINYLDLCLNCRATYMDLYTIGCTIEPPFIWYIQMCMLIWKVCVYFSFVFRDLFVKSEDAPQLSQNYIRPKLMAENSIPIERLGREYLQPCNAKTALTLKFSLTKSQTGSFSI